MKPGTPRARVRLTLVRDLGPAPTTYAQCPKGPCPFTACRHHLPSSPRRCTLRDAPQGPWTLDQIGALLGGICRERVRQIETKALSHGAEMAAMLRVRPDVLPDPSPPDPWEMAGTQWDSREKSQTLRRQREAMAAQR